MAVSGQTHDVVISNQGFMLAVQKGVKMWQVEDTKLLPPSYTTARPTYANVIPDIELALSQDKFVGGFGGQDQEDTAEFYNSDGADAGAEGRVYQGPAKIEEIIPLITNAGFETGNLTGWTVVGSAVASTPGAYEGTWYVALGEIGTQVYQDLPFTTADRGKPITIHCALNGDGTGGGVRVGINDGIGTTWLATVITGVSWVLRSVSRVLDIAATRCRIVIDYQGAAGHWAGADAFTYVGPIKFCRFGGNLYLARGKFLQKWSETDGWVWLNTFAQTITDLKVFADGLYIALGGTNLYWYTLNGTTFIESTDVNGKADLFGTAKQNFVLAVLPNSIRTTTNPKNGGVAWSGVTTIGTIQDNITQIINHPDLLLVCKTDTTYYVVGAVVSQYVLELISETNANSGKNARFWKGDCFIPAGVTSLYKVSSSTDIESISPADYAVDIAAYRTKVAAMDGDSNFLYIILRPPAGQATTTILMKGRELTIAGNTAWRWYPLKTFSSTGVLDCIIDPASIKRLFVACADKVIYFSHPGSYGDLLADPDYPFDTAGDHYSVWEHAEFKDINKAWHSVTILSENLSGTAQTIDVYYRTAAGAGWTLLGTVNTSPSATLYWSSSNASKKLQFKFQLKSSASTNTAILNGYILRAKLKPDKRKIFEFVIVLAEKQANAAGAIETVDVAIRANVLRTANTASWPIVLKDIDNVSYNVDFESMTEQIVRNDESLDTERQYHIRAIEAKLS